MPSASIGTTGCASAFQLGSSGSDDASTWKGTPSFFSDGAELGDVVAVDQVVRVLVEEMRSRRREHDVDLVLARHDPERDAHGLVGAMGGAGILRDDDQHRFSRHGASSARGSGRCR